MQIKDITLDDIRRGKHWKVTGLVDGTFPDAPLEELRIEESAAFGPDDHIVYSTIFVTDAGEVQPRVMIKVVSDMDYGGDYCEYVEGRWRQLGLVPDPNAPFGNEYFANPLEQDPSFVSDDEYRAWHRDGFNQFISGLWVLSTCAVTS